MMNNNLSYECSWQKHRARRRVHAQVTLRSKSAILFVFVACKMFDESGSVRGRKLYSTPKQTFVFRPTSDAKSDEGERAAMIWR